MSDTKVSIYTPDSRGTAYEYWECAKGHSFCTRHQFGYGEGIRPLGDWDY